MWPRTPAGRARFARTRRFERRGVVWGMFCAWAAAAVETEGSGPAWLFTPARRRGFATALQAERAASGRVDALVAVIPAHAVAGRRIAAKDLLDDASARRPVRGLGLSLNTLSNFNRHGVLLITGRGQCRSTIANQRCSRSTRGVRPAIGLRTRPARVLCKPRQRARRVRARSSLTASTSADAC